MTKVRPFRFAVQATKATSAAQWRELARIHGERPALIDAAGTWSYAAVHTRIVKLANALLKAKAETEGQEFKAAGN